MVQLEMMMELERLDDFKALGRILMTNGHISQLYLTECDGCCCHGASYRLFTEVPKFGTSGGHPDTGVNQKIMVAKIYNQPTGKIDKIAKEISQEVRDVSHQLDEYRRTNIRRLK